MVKVNKTQPSVKDMKVRVWEDRVYCSKNDSRYQYKGVAWIKGLKRVKLAEIASSTYGWDKDGVVIFNPDGSVKLKKSMHVRKDYRDFRRLFRQGTRKKVIRQAELVLKRIMSVGREADLWNKS